jgi:hypothetical protein
MTLDRPSDGADGPGETPSEQEFHRHGTGRDVSTGRVELAEPRSREEYYEALRTADGVPVPAGDGKRSGWDTIDNEKRPPLDDIRVTPERTEHILDGDSTDSGGHRHGVGNPGKTEFPSSWDDKKIMDTILDVGRRPDEPPIYQDWNGRWLARGTRDEVTVVVVIASDGRIWSGWPRLGGPGVVKNPKEQ